MVGVETASDIDSCHLACLECIVSVLCGVLCVVESVFWLMSQNSEEMLNVEQAVQLFIQLEGVQAGLSIACI